MKNGDRPAFIPLQFTNNSLRTEYSNGLTKRELFAAMAMQGICGDKRQIGTVNSYAKEIAETAVKMADELLKQLEQ